MPVPSPILPEPTPPVVAPTVMRRFVRTCGHSQRVIWTVGDEAQAARYASTACTTCRDQPVITFAAGWGRTRR